MHLAIHSGQYKYRAGKGRPAGVSHLRRSMIFLKCDFSVRPRSKSFFFPFSGDFYWTLGVCCLLGLGLEPDYVTWLLISNTKSGYVWPSCQILIVISVAAVMKMSGRKWFQAMARTGVKWAGKLCREVEL